MSKVSGNMKGWIRRHVATAGAALATVAMVVLVFRGTVPAERSVGPIVFAWMLALHALSSRLNTERHQKATLQGMIALQKAGVAFRLGRPGEAAQDVAMALRDVAEEECQPKEGTAASAPVPPKQGA